MTEAEWFACTDPERMLEFLRNRITDRKRRLFAVACCRRIWEFMTDERSRKAVELAEKSADQVISSRTIEVVSGEAEEAFEDAISPDNAFTLECRERAGAACSAASYASNSPVVRHFDAVEVLQAAADATFDPVAERVAQATLVRELWETPIRPVPLDIAWLTPTVKQLAVTVYEARAFDRLPILSDALEEAGCTEQAILTHLRGSGPHVRGCWALDLLLCKS